MKAKEPVTNARVAAGCGYYFYFSSVMSEAPTNQLYMVAAQDASAYPVNPRNDTGNDIRNMFEVFEPLCGLPRARLPLRRALLLLCNHERRQNV